MSPKQISLVGETLKTTKQPINTGKDHQDQEGQAKVQK